MSGGKENSSPDWQEDSFYNHYYSYTAGNDDAIYFAELNVLKYIDQSSNIGLYNVNFHFIWSKLTCHMHECLLLLLRL